MPECSLQGAWDAVWIVPTNRRGVAGVVGPGLLGLVLTVQVAFIAAQLPSAPANYAAAAAKFQWTAGLIPCDAALAHSPYPVLEPLSQLFRQG